MCPSCPPLFLHRQASRNVSWMRRLQMQANDLLAPDDRGDCRKTTSCPDVEILAARINLHSVKVKNVDDKIGPRPRNRGEKIWRALTGAHRGGAMPMCGKHHLSAWRATTAVVGAGRYVPAQAGERTGPVATGACGPWPPRCKKVIQK